ncbi:hypothetical protein D3C85_1314750 [compost metagenome]
MPKSCRRHPTARSRSCNAVYPSDRPINNDHIVTFTALACGASSSATVAAGIGRRIGLWLNSSKILPAMLKMVLTSISFFNCVFLKQLCMLCTRSIQVGISIKSSNDIPADNSSSIIRMRIPIDLSLLIIVG